MGLSSAEIVELRRAVARLDALDGAAVECTSGTVLVEAAGVRDPRALVAACQGRGGLELAALRAGLELRREPLALAGATLARLHRDLRALQASPLARDLLTDAPRSLRRALARPPGWLDDRAAALDRLRARPRAQGPLAALAALLPERAGEPRTAEGLARLAARAPWLAPIFELIAALHGRAAAAAALDLHLRSQQSGAADLRRARERAEALAARVLGRTARSLGPGLDLALDDLSGQVLRAMSKPTRTRDQAIRGAVAAALAWPATPPAADPAADLDLAEIPAGAAARGERRRVVLDAVAAAIRAHGEALASRLHPRHDPQSLAALDALVAELALAFPAAPPLALGGRAAPRRAAQARADGPATPRVATRDSTAALAPIPAFTASDVAALAAHWKDAALAGRPLPLADALWLLGREFSPAAAATLAGWLLAGLRPAEVDAVIACGHLKALLAAKGADEAIALARWVARVVPHFRRLGVELELDADLLAHLPAGRRGELALLAHALIQQHARGATPASAARELALLDLGLGLVRGLPDRARALLRRIDEVPAGQGRALFPDFAAWLADDPLLDRFCHLARLAGEDPALSRNLRRDFDQAARLDSQLAHLRALEAPSEGQRARLERLLGGAGEAPPDPAWTRRRLSERTGELLARAYRRLLDAALAEVVRAAFGVVVPAMTPAWQDALRFFLAFERRGGERERSYELLGVLLRHAAAAPGASYARASAENRAWIERVRGRFDVDAWLRPRALPLALGGRRYLLRSEEDPLEVLRMGIPFDTCLSLRGGFNAASTVANALDANKRVLYLRDEGGAVLARKLVAVADDDAHLLGYRVYVAVDGEAKAAVLAAFDQVCKTLSEETGLPWARFGAPARLHGGFWYDDGVEGGPAGDEAADPDLARLCAALGRPTPPRWPRWWRHEITAADARRRGDAALALAAIENGASDVDLTELVVGAHGEARLRARAPHERALARALVARALAGGVPAALALAAQIPPTYEIARAIIDAERLLPPSATIARAWLDAAAALGERGDDDDHGLTHYAFYLDRHLACLPVAEFLAAAARIEAIGARFVAAVPECAACREGAHERIAGPVALAAYARAADPQAILKCLKGPGDSDLALRSCISIAARHPLRAATPSRPDAPAERLDDASPSRLTAAPPSRLTAPARRLDAPAERPDDASPSRLPPAPPARLDAPAADAPVASARAPSRAAPSPPRLLGASPTRGWLARLGDPSPPHPAVLRHLRRLLARRPRLADDADLLAAWLRHRDPRLPSPPPPRPDAAPFESLAERALDPDLLPDLAPYLDPHRPAAAWKPDTWELALHRRVASPWHARLRAIAEGDGDAKEVAAARHAAALLGLDGAPQGHDGPRLSVTLAHLRLAVPAVPPPRPAEAPAGRTGDAEPSGPRPAAALAASARSRDRPSSNNLATPDARAPGAPRRDLDDADLATLRAHPLAIDPAALVAALARWRAVLLGDLSFETSSCDPPTPPRALALLLAVADDITRGELLDQLLAAPPEARHPDALAAILRAYEGNFGPLRADQALQLWRIPTVRPHLVAFLAARHRLDPTPLIAHLSRIAEPADFDGLIGAWMVAAPGIEAYDLPPALELRVLAATLAAGGVSHWYRLYRELHGFADLSAALDLLDALPSDALLPLRAAFDDDRPAPGAETDEADDLRRLWLDDHLTRRLGAPQESATSPAAGP